MTSAHPRTVPLGSQQLPASKYARPCLHNSPHPLLSLKSGGCIRGSPAGARGGGAEEAALYVQRSLGGGRAPPCRRGRRAQVWARVACRSRARCCRARRCARCCRDRRCVRCCRDRRCARRCRDRRCARRCRAPHCACCCRACQRGCAAFVVSTLLEMPSGLVYLLLATPPAYCMRWVGAAWLFCRSSGWRSFCPAAAAAAARTACLGRNALLTLRSVHVLLRAVLACSESC